MMFFTHNLPDGVVAQFAITTGVSEAGEEWRHTVRGVIVHSIRDSRARVLWPTLRDRSFPSTPATREDTATAEAAILRAWAAFQRRGGNAP